METITVKQLKTLMEKWDKGKLDQLRDGQIIDIQTGELTNYEWLPATEASRGAGIGFIGTYDRLVIRPDEELPSSW